MHSGTYSEPRPELKACPVTPNTNTEQITTECVTGETQHAFGGTCHCLCCSVGLQDSSTAWLPVKFPDTWFWKDTNTAPKHRLLGDHPAFSVVYPSQSAAAIG